MGTKRTPRLLAFVAATLLTLTAPEIPWHATPVLAAPRSPVMIKLAPLPPHTRARVLRMVNSSRAAHHLVHLRLRISLSRCARRHTHRMMVAGRLFHTADLVQVLLSTTNATSWGENIALGPSLGGIDDAWMGSALHRQNILDPLFRHAGIGVLRSGGKYWVTLDLYG